MLVVDWVQLFCNKFAHCKQGYFLEGNFGLLGTLLGILFDWIVQICGFLLWANTAVGHKLGLSCFVISLLGLSCLSGCFGVGNSVLG